MALHLASKQVMPFAFAFKAIPFGYSLTQVKGKATASEQDHSCPSLHAMPPVDFDTEGSDGIGHIPFRMGTPPMEMAPKASLGNHVEHSPKFLLCNISKGFLNPKGLAARAKECR